MTVTISRLFHYPVKSARRVEVDAIDVVATGFTGDREYMVVDGTGTMVSQREIPALALADSAAIVAASEPGGLRYPIRMFGWPGEGIDQGDAAAAVVSEVAGISLRVVRFPDDFVRRTRLGNGVSKFADEYPVTVASETSLQQLNSWLDVPVPIERFRPNIVLRGLADPFGEDEIASLTIGEIAIDLVKLCGRCLMTTIDQDTAEKGREPLKMLGAHRVRPQVGGGREIMFAVNAVPRSFGTLRVGDEVTVTRAATSYDERVKESLDAS